jgi:hypothetical protein
MPLRGRFVFTPVRKRKTKFRLKLLAMINTATAMIRAESLSAKAASLALP